MTAELELRIISLSESHVSSHAAIGRYQVTLCGLDLGIDQVQRMHDRPHCAKCRLELERGSQRMDL